MFKTYIGSLFLDSEFDLVFCHMHCSMRSYYRSCVDMEDCNLWTYKYKPTKAVEVIFKNIKVACLFNFMILISAFFVVIFLGMWE